MKGPCARGLAAWIACARTSLPVPVSPSSSTVVSTCAARRAWRFTSIAGGEAPRKLENVYFTRRSSASDFWMSASWDSRRWNFDTIGCRYCRRSKSMNPAAPMTRPRSSLIGTRITTKDSSPNCMMSSMIGSPLRTTSRMRLLGITSSTTLPTASAAEVTFSRAAYLSEIHTMRDSRSTMIAPSHIWSRPSNSDFLAILRTAAGSFSRDIEPPPFAASLSGRRRPVASLGGSRSAPAGLRALRLFHYGFVLPEKYLALFFGADLRGLRVHLLRARVCAHGRRPCADRGVPALEVGEVVHVLALPLRDHPRVGGHVGDGVLLAEDEVASLEPLVEHAV